LAALQDAVQFGIGFVGSRERSADYAMIVELYTQITYDLFPPGIDSHTSAFTAAAIQC
jgi:hypothetical protein